MRNVNIIPTIRAARFLRRRPSDTPQVYENWQESANETQ